MLSSSYSSLDVNNSFIEVTNTTMQLTPPNFSQLATPIRAAAQRILLGVFVAANAFNITVLIMNISFRNIAESLTTTTTYDSTACLAWVCLAPTSTIENVLISMSHAPPATEASSPVSFLCASGSTVVRNAQWRIQNSALQAPARQLRDSWDAMRLAPTSANFKTTFQLDNVSVYLRNTTFTNFRSFFGNVRTPIRSLPSTNNNVATALSQIQLSVFSCASNLWDNSPLIKYSNQLLRPTTADTSTANYSLLTMDVDEGSDWCTLPPSTATTPTPITNPTSTTQADLVAMAYRSSTATTAVLGASLISTSSVGASVVPRLQGIVGAFRLAARCQLSTSSSGDEGVSSDSSGYVANDVSDNPLLLHFVPVAPSLAYAVGALIGNTLLVIAVGVVSRYLEVAKYHAIKIVKGGSQRRDRLARS